MKKIFSQMQVFTFLTILLFGTACNGQDKTGLTKEKVAHTKLIKTIGSPNYNVRCGLQDKAGNLWFGTRNGLYKYDGKSFSQFLVANGLNSNNISCILEDKDGKIWIGTEVGLCLYDGKTFAKIHIPLPKNLPHHNYHDRNSHWVFSIMQAKSGKLWFATIDGVYTYDGKSFTPFIVNEGAAGYLSSNNNVEHILEDKSGNVWFGGRSNEGVYRYDGKSITNFKLKELDSIRFDSNGSIRYWAWPQLQDKNGNIWFSNWDGAYRYDGKSFTSFTKKDGLSGDMVTRIIEDKKGNLWFGGAGLSRYDGKSFTRFTTKDGLITQRVWSIWEDKTGNLWIGGDGGSSLYDGKTFINYSEYKP
jgi:ligand-binding sensor domain-containing protein